jgi:hypothetical protein
VPFDDADLELAFQLHVLDELAAADLATTTREQRFIDRYFPTEALVRRGFTDASGGRTPRYHEAVAAAAVTLPARLDDAGRCSLLEACFRLAVSDREFRIGEGVVLLAAARRLGMADHAFDRFLAEHPEATGMSAAMLDADD